MDTNVLISALFWNGNSRRLLGNCRSGKHRLVTSPPILDELARILMRKFGVPAATVNRYREALLLMADLVMPPGELDALPGNRPDGLVLETAVLGNADAIITGDRHLLKLGSFRGMPIMRPAEL